MRDPLDPLLPPHVRALLRAPATSTHDARTRIMDHIRTLPAPRRLRAPFAGSRWSRRGLLSPVGGLLSAALVLCMIALRMSPLDALLFDTARQIETAAVILGDSVVPRSGAHGSDASLDSPTSARAHHDSLTARVDGYARRVLDTLRIVEFVLRGSSIRTATVLGSFNAWNRGATPLATAGRDEWRARVLVPRDAVATSLNVAFLVNGTKLISAAGGTARSLVYPN
jgi:hypothetical protein